MATDYQIQALEKRLKEMKPDDTGKYSASYYALFNKIKNLNKQIKKESNKSWEDYLSK